VSTIDDMRGLLVEVQGRAPSAGDVDSMSRGHREFVEDLTQSRLSHEYDNLAKSLESVSRVGALARAPGGQLQEVVRSALSIEQRIGTEPVEPADFDALPGVECERLFARRPTMEFSRGLDFGEGGELRKFSRANAESSTLEVVAAVGEIGERRWDPTEQFILPFNRTSASIAGFLELPEVEGTSELRFTTSLQIETVYPWGTAPGNAAPLTWTLSPQVSELPFGAVAAVSCGARLTLHGPQGSHSEYRRMVSRRSAHGTSELRDYAPNGRLTLPTRVLVDSTVRSLLYVIEVECETFAEGAGGAEVATFAQFECRHKEPTEILGIYSPPAHVRVDSITPRLCRLPKV
jgi:hypothetical protein